MSSTAAGSSLSAALAGPPLVLDGGLSTELERRGHDLSGRLWSARLLNDAPEAVVAVHSAFLRAGAQVITTASYQAGPEGFIAAGFTYADAERLARRSVELARRARDETADAGNAAVGMPGARPDSTRVTGGPWIAGSVGPYATLLADGSEYTGDYGPEVSLRRLREFHRPRLAILAAAGVDVLAVETVPSLLEAEALITELSDLGHPAWLSLSTVTREDGVVRTRRGEPAAEAFALVSAVDAVVAVGVNCTGSAGLDAAIEVAAQASGKPVIAYPNSGEGWDPVARSWTGSTDGLAAGPDAGPDTGLDPAEIDGWLAAGARMIGGCCRVGPNVIADIARQLSRSPTS